MGVVPNTVDISLQRYCTTGTLVITAFTLAAPAWIRTIRTAFRDPPPVGNSTSTAWAGQDGAYLLRPPHQLRTIAALRRLSIANLQAWLDYYGQPYPDDADRSALLALLFSELGVPANATVNNLHGRPH